MKKAAPTQPPPSLRNIPSHQADTLFWSGSRRAIAVVVFLLAMGIFAYALTRLLAG